jgi:hypothetical protein
LIVEEINIKAFDILVKVKDRHNAVSVHGAQSLGNSAIPALLPRTADRSGRRLSNGRAKNYQPASSGSALQIFQHLHQRGQREKTVKRKSTTMILDIKGEEKSF